MKHKFSRLVVSLAILGVFSPSAISAVDSQTKKIALLESQVADLQKQMHALKKQGNNQADPPATKKTTVAANANPPGMTPSKNPQIQGPTDLPITGPLYLPVDLDVPGQSFVSSGPYIGIPLEFSGGNLIINTPSVNEDVILLNVDLNVDKRLRAMGRDPEGIGSHILLSGLVEGQALYRNGGGASSDSTDIDLTSVNLDAYILGPSPWTSAFIEFAYDNNIGTQTGSFSNNDRVLDSRVFVNKAFIVLGDFTRSPYYASLGQMFVPFGVYSTTMVSSPLQKILARTPARAAVVGYKSQSENSLLATGYIFNGPTQTDNTNRINNAGVNLSYKFTKGEKFSATFGGGIIKNIADSGGMQITGNNNFNPPLFGGFGGPIETFTNTAGVVEQVATGDENLVHQVPAVDANMKLGMGDFQFIGEYITAIRHFSPADMTFNGDGAQPQAMNVELVYNIPYFVNPTSVGVSYQWSQDALAIGLPSQRYSLTINRSFWKNTLQSLEFRRDYDYERGDTSTGSGIAGPTGTSGIVNMITFQFDYYF